MEQMITDGITEVIVQPTHVINGIENDLMKEDALAFKNHFERITFGDPLLTTQQDHVEIVNAICQEFSNLPADCALILMGHGTSHYANDVYAALDYRFKDLGFSNIHLATVEGYPTLENVTRMVKEQEAKKAVSYTHLMERLKKIPGIQGCVILSTCNRMELWASTKADWNGTLLEELCKIKEVDPTQYGEYFVCLLYTSYNEYLDLRKSNLWGNRKYF